MNRKKTVFELSFFKTNGKPKYASGRSTHKKKNGSVCIFSKKRFQYRCSFLNFVKFCKISVNF